MNKTTIIGILIFLLITILAAVSIRHTWNRVERQYSEEALKIAEIAASSLNGEMLKKLNGVPEDSGTIAYENIKQRLIKIKSIAGEARFSYLLTKREGKIYFIADSEPENSKDCSPTGQEYTEADSNLVKLFDYGDKFITPPITDRWGTWVSVLVAIKDLRSGKTIAVFAMDYDAEKWRSSIVFNELRASFVMAIAFFLLLILSIKLVLKNNSLKNEAVEHKRDEDALRDSEERFRVLFESAKDGILQLTYDGSFISMNESFARMHGYTKDELLNMNLKDLDSPEATQLTEERMQKLLAGESITFEVEHFCKNGKTIPLEVSVNLVSVRGEEIILGFHRDITERKKTEIIIRQQNNELKELNASKDKFFSIIAHDLRSPFQGILSMTEMMAENINDFSHEEIVKYHSELNKSTQNLYKLLQNLLDWTLLKKDAFDFSPQQLSLSSTVSASIEQINKRAIQKGITIVTEIPEELIVFVDERMINSTLSNLLSNAIKFTRNKGKVTVNAKTVNNGMIEIVVEDSGIGMSERMVNKLFKLDEKTGRKGTDGELSTGLGLLLCKEFVEKHGGRIWAESEEGKGSRFIFTVPCSEIET